MKYRGLALQAVLLFLLVHALLPGVVWGETYTCVCLHGCGNGGIGASPGKVIPNMESGQLHQYFGLSGPGASKDTGWSCIVQQTYTCHCARSMGCGNGAPGAEHGEIRHNISAEVAIKTFGVTNSPNMVTGWQCTAASAAPRPATPPPPPEPVHPAPTPPPSRPLPPRSPAHASFKWIAWHGSLPGNALIGGQENGSRLAVCRVDYHGGKHPGKVVGRNCNIGWGGQEVVNGGFEVLVVEGNAHPRWAAVHGGNVPPNMWAGTHYDGKTGYVCRGSFQGGVHPGKVVGSACNIGWGGKEQVLTSFEVLLTP